MMECVSVAPGLWRLLVGSLQGNPFGCSRTVSRDHSLSLHASDHTENNPCASLRLLWPVYRPRDRQDSRLATSGKAGVLSLYNQIVARVPDTRGNLVSVTGRQPSSSVTLPTPRLRSFRIASSDTIYPDVSTGA